MKAMHIIYGLILILALCFAFMRKDTPSVEPVPEAAARPLVERKTTLIHEAPSTSVRRAIAIAVAEQQPVQPVEERGDAMLFEIEALHHMPFDQEITMPFD